MSDWDQAAPVLVSNLQHNADANQRSGGGTPDVKLFDWFDALKPGFEPIKAGLFDVVIGADCMYSDDEEVAMSLAAAMRCGLLQLALALPVSCSHAQLSGL